MIDKTVQVYIGSDHAPVVVDVAQYDDQWNYHFQVFYENQRWTIPDDCTATLVGKKKDGHVAMYNAEIVDNEIVVNPNFQLTACPGNVAAEIRILAQNGQSVATPRLVFAVAVSPGGDEDVASGTTLTAFAEIFEDAAALMEAANNIAGLTASASTLSSGSAATATVTGGTGGTPFNIAFGIPKGDKGAKGDKGDKGDRGIDGTGAVSTVMGLTVDEDHDIPLLDVMKLIYPVGSIYMTLDGNFNPTSPRDGVPTHGWGFEANSWQKIENSFLLGASTSYAAGSTGGNSTVSLTAANNGPHEHNVVVSPADSSYPLAGLMGAKNMVWSTSLGNAYSRTGTMVSASSNNGTFVAAESGSGEAFSIMPPYTAVYIWQRIA